MTEHMVLDAWAIMAWLDGEPESVDALIQDLIDSSETNAKLPESLKRVLGKTRSHVEHIKLSMSIINLGEVFYSTGRKRGKERANQIWDEIQAGPIEIVSASDSIVHMAAQIKMKYLLSYADGFAVATAMACQATLVTGDPELKHLHEVPILWLGQA